MSKAELLQKIADARLTQEETKELIDYIAVMRQKEQCPTCKHFILCNLDKQAFYKTTGRRCAEYEEKEKKDT